MPSAPYYEQGAYVAEVTGQALGKAGTGTPQLVLRFKVIGKPDPHDATNYQSVQEYERTMFQAITLNTINFVLEGLKQLGYTDASFGPLDPSHPNHHSFVGKQIEVYCKHERDLSSNIRERWQLSRGAPALKVDPLDSKGVRELDSLFGRALKGVATTAPVKQQPVPAGNMDGLGITDDDVPF
jgi:hypothetical protein